VHARSIMEPLRTFQPSTGSRNQRAVSGVIVRQGVWMGRVAKPILVVEDEQEVRSLLKLMLAESDFEVIVAKDGTAALHELWKRRGNVALVVTDVDMGRMNGLELAQSVRSEYPAVPILFVSGLPIPQSELEAVAPGTVLITKPFGPATLVQALRKLIGE
jgi:two-component system, cell cycle sensor histidine kinase and response regulator CckA